MKFKVKPENIVFTGLKIIAWVLFVGLCIEAGGWIVNFIFSLVRPDFVQNLYQKMDLYFVYENSTWAFFCIYGFILIIALLKAVLFYQVVLLVTKIDLTKPFNRLVSKQILTISYYTLAIGFLSFMGRQITRNLEHYGLVLDQLNTMWTDGQAFILMSAVVYIIGTIFSKGVAYQEELEETV